MKRKRIIIISSILLGILIVIWVVNSTVKGPGVEENLTARVETGPFAVIVQTSGELEAKNSTKIYGPSNLRSARVYEVKINDLVEEGTIVNKGDRVAQLDPSALADRIKDEELNFENNVLSFESAKIDTAIELQTARNALDNLRSEMEERKLELEKSKYEPPVTIKQAEVALSKVIRNYEQSVDDYQLKLQRARAKVRSTVIKMEKQKKDIDMLEKLKEELTIYAPKSGMVIYSRERRGERKTIGSNISTWDPVVAELPDMRYMISKTYVNEVDIRKIKIGQEAEISFDAFPDKNYNGKVIKVANVGEDLNNSDAKVFQVDIEMIGTDPDLRPGMSTVNSIITQQLDEALQIPIEAVFSEGDSINYVYKFSKFTAEKIQIITGSSNDRFIQVLKGLEAGDKVLFLPPENGEELELISLAQ